MKSTYDILSIYLDHQLLPQPAPLLIGLDELPECLPIEAEYSLFDLPICRRKISGMRLISALSADETNKLVDRLVDCKEITVTLEYSSVSQTAQVLYLKRVLQAVTLLKSKHPQLIIILATDNQEWCILLKRLYENHVEKDRQLPH